MSGLWQHMLFLLSHLLVQLETRCHDSSSTMINLFIVKDPFGFHMNVKIVLLIYMKTSIEILKGIALNLLVPLVG